MKNKKWWKYILPIVIITNIIVVLMILGSARSGDQQNIVEVENNFEFTPPEIPDSVSFAGEPMPLDRFDVKEALDRELLSNTFFHSQTIRYMKLAPRYFSIIEPILKEKGIHEDFKYLAVAESGLNPKAVSPARAVGFWQFLSGTARDYGLEVNNEVDERYHIEKATYAACDYLKDSYKKFGSWALVAASYNRGVSGINRQLERQKTNDYYDLLITTETARYVYRIVALKLIMENPERYNFGIKEEDKYPIIPIKEVEVSGAVTDFADFAREHGISYKLLKDFNPWLRETNLTNSRKKKYLVKIPEL